MEKVWKKEGLKVAIFYPDIDSGDGYPRDILRLFNELDQKDDIFVTKIKSVGQLFLKSRKFDCVHLFGFFSFKIILAAILCIAFNKKYIISVLGHLLPRALCNGKHKKVIFLNFIGRFVLKKASKIHVFTDYEANALEKLQIATPTFKSFFGIYPEDIKHQKNVLPMVKKKPFLFFFGRLDVNQKGLDILLEGFEKYCLNSQKFDLIISGRNYKNGNSYIKNFLENANSKSRIEFLGEVSEVEKENLYSKAEAIIYPCHFDGNPRPLRHALCRKKKILTTFQSNFADQLESKNWGVLFENTSDALAEGIEKFDKIVSDTPYEEPAKTRSWAYCSKVFMLAYQSILRQ